MISSLIPVHPQTPTEGASTAIYAAAASELEGIGGLYLYNGRKTESSALSYDERLQTKLWKESCALVGLQKAWDNINTDILITETLALNFRKRPP